MWKKKDNGQNTLAGFVYFMLRTMSVNQYLPFVNAASMCVTQSWPGKSNLWPSYHYKRVAWCLRRPLSPRAEQLRILLLRERNKTQTNIEDKRERAELLRNWVKRHHKLPVTPASSKFNLLQCKVCLIWLMVQRRHWISFCATVQSLWLLFAHLRAETIIKWPTTAHINISERTIHHWDANCTRLQQQKSKWFVLYLTLVDTFSSVYCTLCHII